MTDEELKKLMELTDDPLAQLIILAVAMGNPEIKPFKDTTEKP